MSACDCPDCTLAGCVEPPVTLSATFKHPQRELHGRELNRFYEERRERRAMFERIKAQLLAKGIQSQRGDEPR
jgi:hypothetical protein